MRHAGLLVPLFSIPSSTSWGIGEIPDLATMGAWAASAGMDRLMILPLGTVPGGETSPYSSISTMAIDPVYIAVDRVEDFARTGGVASLSADAARALARAQQAKQIDYAAVRAAKHHALCAAFDRFHRDEWEQFTERSAALAAYIARERWWLDDYALFQAISASRSGEPWTAWPADLAAHEARALDDARRRHAKTVLREQYWQWIAETQWRALRAALRAQGVTVVGDMPFGVGANSPEVWARAGEFMLDVSTGVPPDAFSEEGQDWQLPTYRWETIRAGDYAWLRARIRRAVALYDGVRVDHLVGLFRTYGRTPDRKAFFTPAGEVAQRRQGEEILRIFLDSGLIVLAEDLGTIPGFVRQSLADLGVPGTKVLRWERVWEARGQPFVDPVTYPAVSVAMTGTHDNEPLAEWWETASPAERTALFALDAVQRCAGGTAAQPWSDALRDALLAVGYRSGSNDVFLPIQDIFGWRDRINLPGTIGDHNWTWRLPWPVDHLAANDIARERATFLCDLAHSSGRGPANLRQRQVPIRARSLDDDQSTLIG